MQLTNLTKHILFGVFIATLGLSACGGDNPKKLQEDLQEAVIATHDSVMADMGLLMERKIQINKITRHLDSLKSVNTSLDTVQAKAELTQTVEQLAIADEGMMTWMHNFDPDYTGKSHEEIMEYLNNQKLKIDLVERSIRNVIIKSDSIIAVYK